MATWNATIEYSRNEEAENNDLHMGSELSKESENAAKYDDSEENEKEKQQEIDWNENIAFNKAMDLDGFEFKKSSLSVEEAKPKGDNDGGGKSGGHFRGRRGGGRF
ncbi:Uncharacterized protein Fot_01576 [Forsythia ovata]|uniref:Uncharacterized protein n=1 Tax=Forsythia ovata TaxID=205694 RepID=A0ABD1X4D5_9LAMI